jgi:hypothetical protein
VSDVVAATGHLLDRCRPQTAGVSVVGRIDPPSGHGGGFFVAQVLVLETSRPGGRRAPDWFWFSSGPKKSGDFRCGGGGESGDVNSPNVSFIASCGRGR